MHVQIVNFRLEAMTDREYREVCDSLAPAFAALPGLVSKTWLADEASNTYGGVYTWRDRQAMEAFADTDLFKGFVADPALHRDHRPRLRGARRPNRRDPSPGGPRRVIDTARRLR